MQSETGHCMHQHRLAKRWTLARPAFQVDRRFHVHERKWDELGEAARAYLQCTHAQQMACPVLITLDVPEHDGRGGLEAHAMGGLDRVQPGLRVELVRTDDAADLVVENFRGGAR